jgi:hypothetical protein
MFYTKVVFLKGPPLLMTVTVAALKNTPYMRYRENALEVSEVYLAFDKNELPEPTMPKIYSP